MAKLFGFRVKISAPNQWNVWTRFLIVFSVLSLFEGLAATHWLAAYTKGDSIIPKETELIRKGPFSMTEIGTRNALLVGFSNSNGKVEYSENIVHFSVPPNVTTNLIEKYSNHPTAYLSIYKNNPIRKIWGVTVNGFNIFPYQRAVFIYKNESSAQYLWFYVFFSFLAWFIISIFELKRDHDSH